VSATISELPPPAQGGCSRVPLLLAALPTPLLGFSTSSLARPIPPGGGHLGPRGKKAGDTVRGRYRGNDWVQCRLSALRVRNRPGRAVSPLEEVTDLRPIGSCLGNGNWGDQVPPPATLSAVGAAVSRFDLLPRPGATILVGGRTTRTGCATPTMSVFTVRVDEAKVGEAECTLSARKGGGDERAPSQTIGDDASNLQKAKGVIGARPSLPVQQRLDRRA